MGKQQQQQQPPASQPALQAGWNGGGVAAHQGISRLHLHFMHVQYGFS